MTRYERLWVGGLYFTGITMLLDAYATWTRGGAGLRLSACIFGLLAAVFVCVAAGLQRTRRR